jgi:hypothetical protein
MMKHSRAILILLITILFSVVSFANLCADTGIQEMKMPQNGSCDDFYLLIEGVCVHPTALREDANEMKAAINEFKKTGKAPPMATSPQADESSQDPDCTRAKNKLEKYQREGVMGINPSTGKLEKMKGEAAEQVIQNAKDDVEIFCEN